MTNAELAILGLVTEAPRHGYEIEQLIEERGMRDWTVVGFSSIYYILGKLEQRGLIGSRKEPAEGRGPDRKVFSIRPAGRKAWQQATLEALSMPTHPDSSFLLGLAGTPGISPQEAVSALRQYRRNLIQSRDYVEQTWRARGDLPLFLEAMFEYSYNLLQTELEWLDRYIPRFESQIE
jgi:DNA-binding PadR family transcriptional regulator